MEKIIEEYHLLKEDNKMLKEDNKLLKEDNELLNQEAEKWKNEYYNLLDNKKGKRNGKSHTKPMHPKK